MPRCNRAAAAVCLALMAWENTALAQVVQYSGRATFLADTAATAEPSWPNLASSTEERRPHITWGT